MPKSVEIDQNSGFCGGVIRAVSHADEYLNQENSGILYSLGAIVHNEAELKRLGAHRLAVINDIDEVKDKPGATVLIRAHGEPPKTYERAKELNINLIDCTCPVVLKLQENIRQAWVRISSQEGQIVIFGKVGHAEVLGLVGQIDGDTVVIEDMDMLNSALIKGKIRTNKPIEIFSQTTKSPDEYEVICGSLKKAVEQDGGRLTIHNTICRQVATRHSLLSSFALNHDAIVFVAGKQSSNGKVLYNLCRSLNIRTYYICNIEDIRKEWFRNDDNIGVCGATSTPKWLLDEVAQKILQLS